MFPVQIQFFQFQFPILFRTNTKKISAPDTGSTRKLSAPGTRSNGGVIYSLRLYKKRWEQPFWFLSGPQQWTAEQRLPYFTILRMFYLLMECFLLSLTSCKWFQSTIVLFSFYTCFSCPGVYPCQMTFSIHPIWIFNTTLPNH